VPTNLNLNQKNMNNSRIGFMQGRLSPLVNGKIQEFPWDNWRQEFDLASGLGFTLMEWTLDQDRLYESPLMTEKGQLDIIKLSSSYGIKIPSLTGDCFMQSPFWKLSGVEKKDRQKDLTSILSGCEKVGIKQIVIPLVDGGRIDNSDQELALLEFLLDIESDIRDMGIQVVFESDLGPDELKLFIGQFNPKSFGINYDIGNSAALGFNVEKELDAYGDRILNVHIKDRILGGTTVPLGTGSADFEAVFSALGRAGYQGNYILQTARAQDGDHAGALSRYNDMAVNWIACHEA
jgi:L-ribulose-5-phosphate 3-epimerase